MNTIASAFCQIEAVSPSLLNANTLCGGSAGPCWCCYLTEGCQLPTNGIWVPLSWVSRVLAAAQPLSAVSQCCPWTLPFLHCYLTRVCQRPGVIRCLEARGAEAQHWHRKSSCTGGDICTDLPVKTDSTTSVLWQGFLPLVSRHHAILADKGQKQHRYTVMDTK